MKLEIFEKKEYRQILQQWLDSQPNQGHGAKKKIALAARCQPAYVTKVFRGDQNFSLEQAHAIGQMIGLSPDETHYFVLLIQKERAGTPALQRYFEGLVDRFLDERLVLRKSLGVKPVLKKDLQNTYYSSWVYAAVHVLADVPGYQTRDTISKRLHLPQDRISEVLDFLTSAGLLELVDGCYRMTSRSMRLGGDSKFINLHHHHWRVKSLEAVSRSAEDDLHYSSVVSISAEDAYRIRSDLVQSIKEAKKKIKHSKPEELYSLCLDFFSL
jgi:uncharacterized protein (TIGR02147 family)